MGQGFPAAVLAAAVLLAGCTYGTEPGTGELPGPGDDPSHEGAYGPPDRITAVTRDLDTIWEVAFSPDDRIFLTERQGRILTLGPGSPAPTVWARPPAVEFSEAGLMGLALDPGFPDQPHVYVCHTYREDDGGLRNRIVRYTEQGDGTGGAPEVLLDGIDGAGIHDGCRLGFGPDGLLYVTMGDASDASKAQDPDELNGKVLRLTDQGETPADNPYGNPVFTLGHRNPQGLAFHPATGVPYITEHGPENHDEINVLEAGDNYGWPHVRGKDDGGGRFHPAIWTSGSGGTVAPAGAAFIEVEGHSLDGAFVFATLKASQLHVMTLDEEDPRRITEERILFDGDFGRLRAVVWGLDDALYLSTSNEDGRGQPGPSDDRLIRVPLPVLEDAWETAG